MDNFIGFSVIGLWLIVAFNLFLTLGLIRHAKLTSSGKTPTFDLIEIGSQAPDLMLTSLLKEERKLDSFFASDVALVVISPDCVPCQAQLPKLAQLWPKAKNASTDIIVTSLGDADTTEEMLNLMNVKSLPVYLPRNRDDFIKDFKIPGTPAYFYITRDGTITERGFMQDDWDKLAHRWESAVAN